MNRSRRWLSVLFASLMAGVLVGSCGRAFAEASAFEELPDEAKWYLVVSAGLMDFEGDQLITDGFFLSGLVGYDLSYRWSVEGGLILAPSLGSHEVGGYEPDWSSTYAGGLLIDGIFHTRPFDRFDIYLAAGLGYIHYGEKPSRRDADERAPAGDQDDIQLRGGGGLTYNINDMWAVRADFRTMLVGFGSNPNANSTLSAGAIWHWGAHVPAKITATGGGVDTDRDGLTDHDEINVYRTDPYNPDTDADGLTDGEEVLKYKTDPLNPDTDMDMLKDGEEVKVYETDPLDADTDDGGVIDGHEVLEDFTNPRKGHGDDDLIKYTLYIEFDTDKADIKPRFHADIDVIGKTLERNPTWTAKVEGHADQRAKSTAEHNIKLSDRRAHAVLDYIARTHKIEKSRLRAKGYGYSRPKVPNNLKARDGTPENRRVEVYIRKGAEPLASAAAFGASVPVGPAVIEKGDVPAKRDSVVATPPVVATPAADVASPAPAAAPAAVPLDPLPEDK